MFAEYRKQWQLSKVKPGDGSSIPPWRFWQLFGRSLFSLDLGDGHLYEVDVRHGRDSSSEKRPAALYRDGRQLSVANVPVMFPVPGGVVEVATNQFGLKRMHYVTDAGEELLLRPHRRSQEGLRARFGQRFPLASAVIGGAAIVILLGMLVIGAPQLAQKLTEIPPVAEHIGTFVSPIVLPLWANIAVGVAGVLAGLERAMTLRTNWLVDLGHAV